MFCQIYQDVNVFPSEWLYDVFSNGIDIETVPFFELKLPTHFVDRLEQEYQELRLNNLYASSVVDTMTFSGSTMFH